MEPLTLNALAFWCVAAAIMGIIIKRWPFI